MSEPVIYKTKPFMSGRSQALRIPKELRLKEEEVVINRVGESLVITPQAVLEQVFYNGLAMLPEDFLADDRPEETPNEEVSL